MKVLVTGATGYVGKYLIKRLLRENDIEVLAIVREGTSTKDIQNSKVTILRSDLTNPESLTDALSGIDELDAVYHLAAGLSGSYYELMMNSVVATDNLFKALVNCKIHRFVLVSSFSVYKLTELSAGKILDENVPVETELSLRDSYTATKVKQERLVRRLCNKRDTPLVIIRPGKIYGPGTDLLPPQLGIRIPGLCYLMMGGRHVIPFSHVENCADAIFLAGKVKETGKLSVINMVDDDLPTQREFVKLHKKYLGRISGLIQIPDIVFKGVVVLLEFLSKKSKGNIPPVITRYRAANLWKPLRYDNSTGKKILGWTPSVSIERGLKETFLAEKRLAEGY